MNKDEKIAGLKSMVAEIKNNMDQEIRALESSNNNDLLDHFGNKVLKIAWEASKFENGESLMDFDQIEPAFQKMNLGLSRYQRILDKLSAKDFDNFFEAKSRVLSTTQIQCDHEGCAEVVVGQEVQSRFLDHYFGHVKERYKQYACEECEEVYRRPQ